MRFFYSNTYRAILLSGVCCFLFSHAHAVGLDQPHNTVNSIGCLSCHDMVAYDQENLIPLNGHVQMDDDDTLNNNQCWGCHDGDPAQFVKTHSSLQTSDRYGNWTVECGVCHNQHSQEQNRVYGSTYGKFIGTRISLEEISGTVPPKTGYRSVKFLGATGANSFADGDTAYDGICEVCHTKTNHFRNTGEVNVTSDGYDHTSAVGTDCMNCHSHANGFGHGGGSGTGCVECHGHDAGTEYDPDAESPYIAGGAASEGRGSFQSHSTHTETDTDDQRGPGIYCDSCHNINKFPLFRSVADPDAELSLDATDVCDTCHSREGVINGVDDPTVGAKKNWHLGIYDGETLRIGKEMWCGACHDDVPANSKQNGTGVSARNMLGDNTSYGYYRTGHGNNPAVDCVTCHDVKSKHIDHTYRSVDQIIASWTNPTNYRFYEGKSMELPYSTASRDNSDFQLCYTCHNPDLITDKFSTASNFRSDAVAGYDGSKNFHWIHVQFWNTNCLQCHDPHGTNRARLTRPDINGDFRVLKLNGGDGKYYEQTDPVLWNNPAENNGGVITSGPGCAACHSSVAEASLDAGLGPVEANFDGWYVRTYTPQTYAVNFDLDNDSVADDSDNCPNSSNPGQEDGDGDHIGDVCDNCLAVANSAQADTDSDGQGDSCDVCAGDADNDTDNDAICVGTGFMAPKTGQNDNCPTIANTDQADEDNDGVGDVCDNCISDPNSNQADGDNDGVGDVCDNCVSTANSDQADGDNDTVGDSCDNCINTTNTDQADADSDTIGNACDLCPDDPDNDIDGDGICVGVSYTVPKTAGNDNCPAISNPDQADRDFDGIGDACDICPDDPANDIDMDYICVGAGFSAPMTAGNDNCGEVANPDQSDADGDGFGDACDCDYFSWSQAETAEFDLGDYTSTIESFADSISLVAADRISLALIKASETHTCGLTNTGEVFCWGDNISSYGGGNLGDGTTTNRYVPVKVLMGDASAVPADNDGTYLGNIKEIDVGENYTCALSHSGFVYCWGRNYEKQLGDGTTNERLVPTLVLKGEAITGDYNGNYLSNISGISTGDKHACAVSAAGIPYCWGEGGSGRLGQPASVDQGSPVRVVYNEATPPDADLSGLKNIKQISAGNEHTCAVANSGAVYCWGASSYGKLGSTANGWYGPVRVVKGEAVPDDSTNDYLAGIQQVSAGSSHSCAMAETGNLYCWGNNNYGQLGAGAEPASSNQPLRVLAGGAVAADTSNGYLTNVRSLDTSVGYSYTCASSENGVYCWGYNAYYQLGDNTNIAANLPVRVLKGADTLSGDHDSTYLNGALHVSTGRFWNCTLSMDGNPYCWGDATSLTWLGNNSTSGSRLPVRIHGVDDVGFLDLRSAAYGSPGAFISAAHDTGSNIAFDTIHWNANIPSGTLMNVKVRSDATPDMSGAADWSSCTIVTSGSDLSSSACVTDGHQYVQYRLDLSTSDNSVSPVLAGITLNYYANGDTDGDGYCAAEDNCPGSANNDQADSDNDSIGDICDLCPDDPDNDVDNDGICGGSGFMVPKTGDNDNCPDDANPSQENVCALWIQDSRADFETAGYTSYQVRTDEIAGVVRLGSSSSWIAAETADTGDQAGLRGIDIHVDQNDKAHIGLNERNSVRYATNVSGSWIAATAEDASSDFSRGVSLALDSEGAVHLAWQNDSGSGSKIPAYATNKSGAWVAETLGNNGWTFDDVTAVSLAIDSSDAVYIAYRDFVDEEVRYAVKEYFNFHHQTMSPMSDAGDYPSLVIDGNDIIHLAHARDNGDIIYSTNLSGSWQDTVAASSVDGLYVSLAVDSTGYAHVCFYDRTSESLQYATNASGSWQVQTLDNSADVGKAASIAVDNFDKLHISYHDSDNTKVKYASNSSGAWTIENVADRGGCWQGYHTGVETGSGDLPHIAYFYASDDCSTNETRYTRMNRTYDTTGIYTSSIHDTGGSIDYKEISWQSVLPAGTALIFKVRSSGSSDMSGATAWGVCNPVTNGMDISGNNCITDGDRYIQYRIEFSTTETLITPSVKSVSIKFGLP